MSWTRFDQAASVHAKCVLAGNDAASFWQWAVQWANRNNTDGYIDGRLLHTVTPVPIAKEIAKALAEACVEARIKPGGSGLLERAEGGSYIVHDYHDFQPPADDALKSDWLLSKKRSEAGRKGAEARWQTGMAKQDGKSDGNPSRTRASDGTVGSVGSDPEHGKETPESATEDPPEPEHTYDLAWRLWREMYEKSRRRYGRYLEAGVQDERAVQLLGRRAYELSGGIREKTEAILRHWFSSYLRDDGDVGCHAKARHPLRLLERRLPTYGEPKPPKPIAQAKPREPEQPPLSDAEHAERANAAVKALARGLAPKEAANGEH